MTHEQHWDRLLDLLNGLGNAAEVGPGQIKVTLEVTNGSTRVIEILMTRDELDEMVGVAWGSFGSELERHLIERVLGLQQNERFLVYANYDLYPSETEHATRDPEFDRLRELALQLSEGIGRWAVLDRDGNVLDEFRNHRD